MKHLEEHIKEAYNHNHYLEEFRTNIPENGIIYLFLNKLNQSLQPGSKILDLGCGPSVPFDSFLLERGHDILGVDISEKMVETAKRLSPKGKFICASFKDLGFKKHSFDAIMMLYSLYHIDRKEHKKLLKRMVKWLCPGGKMMLTLWNENPEELKESNNFCGEKMYWSFYPVPVYLKMLDKMGMKVIYMRNEREFDMEENHDFILLEKQVKKAKR